MGATSAIEWTDASWTPIRARDRATGKVGWHCTHASEGCRYCYAEGINRRLGTGLDYKPVAARQVEIFLDRKMLLEPLRWRKPRMVFVCSMTDLFADFVPDSFIDRVFAVMALGVHLHQVLTKRSARMAAYISDPETPARVWAAACEIMDPLPALARQGATWGGDRPWPLRNVWLGFSAEDQENFDERSAAMVPLADAGWLTWCSAEPMLGRIKLGAASAWLKWLVVGGESGPKARPLWTPNVRLVVRQCQRAAIPAFVKQLGGNVQDRNDAGFDGCEPHEWPDPDPFDVHESPNGYSDEGYQGAPVRIRLKSRKGGDMAEWPEDLRVRQMPAAAGAPA